MSRVHKPSGTTHRIREQLNFCDDKKWKQFSSRRLELIDKFSLSERKASEQDENIRQIATILRTEFGYPTATSAEFEKLVTAAVQSVRRNRKRSTKTRGRRSELSSATSDEDSLVSRATSRTTSPVHAAAHSAAQAQAQPVVHSAAAPAVAAAHTTVPIIQPKPLRMVFMSSSSLHQQVSNSTTFKQSYDEFMRDVVKDLTTNPVSRQKKQQEAQQTGQDQLEELALSTHDFSLLNLALAKDKRPAHEDPQDQHPQDQHVIPFFLKEKLMHYIQSSKTLVEYASAAPGDNNNLLRLGHDVVFSAVSFVLEKFFGSLSANSVDYVYDKLSSPESLSELCIKLVGNGTRRNLNQLPQEWRIKLLNFIIGGVVKDFGFDPCVYPLTEIFHDSILKKYPLVCKEGKSSGTDSFKSAVLASLPLKPEIANRDMNKKVVIKFGDKEQRFVFHLLSNGAPTVQEILENSSNLFQINRDKVSSLVIVHQSQVVKDDAQLAALLNGFSNQELVLELKDQSKLTNSNSSSLSGLQILSSVSQVAAENTVSSPSSMATLQNIISRIGSPIGGLKKEDASLSPILHPPSIPNKHGKNFINGLPQPVFQPLL